MVGGRIASSHSRSSRLCPPPWKGALVSVEGHSLRSLPGTFSAPLERGLLQGVICVGAERKALSLGVSVSLPHRKGALGGTLCVKKSFLLFSVFLELSVIPLSSKEPSRVNVCVWGGATTDKLYPIQGHPGTYKNGLSKVFVCW